MKTTLLVAALCAAGLDASPAAPLSESTVTEIVRSVDVVATATKAAQPAALNALVRAPDLVRTGVDSRVEMTAADQTITRIGANTVFTFELGERNLRRKSTGTSETSATPCHVIRATPFSAVVLAARRSGGSDAVSSWRCWVTGWIVSSSWA